MKNKVNEFFTYDQIYMTLLEMGVIDIDKYLREPDGKPRGK